MTLQVNESMVHEARRNLRRVEPSEERFEVGPSNPTPSPNPSPNPNTNPSPDLNPNPKP